MIEHHKNSNANSIEKSSAKRRYNDKIMLSQKLGDLVNSWKHASLDTDNADSRLFLSALFFGGQPPFVCAHDDAPQPKLTTA